MYLQPRELINEAYGHIEGPQDDDITHHVAIDKAAVLAQLAIAAALDDIARSFDLDGISDGVKQMAVELGGLNTTISNQ